MRMLDRSGPSRRVRASLRCDARRIRGRSRSEGMARRTAARADASRLPAGYARPSNSWESPVNRQNFPRSLLLVLSSFTFGAAAAQTLTADLHKPPADSRHFIIQSTGGKHGDSYIWVTADGTRM